MAIFAPQNHEFTMVSSRGKGGPEFGAERFVAEVCSSITGSSTRSNEAWNVAAEDLEGWKDKRKEGRERM